MRIHVGETYETPQGQPVRILYKSDMFMEGHDLFCPFVGDNGLRYTDEGKTSGFFADASQTLQKRRVPEPQTIGQSVGNIIGRLIDMKLRNR